MSGRVLAIDIAARTVDVKRTANTAEWHPCAVFVKSTGPNDGKQADGLFRLGEWVNEHALEPRGRYEAAIDLLLCRPPRLASDAGALIRPGESTLYAAKRIADELRDSILAIQRPPGAILRLPGT